ncbi:hypothetical protein EMCRGX_G031301 [Ephydatia muelleri]
MNRPSLVEQHGSRSPYRRYFCDSGGPKRARADRSGDLLANIRKFIKEAFLPQGYPESVSEDYLSYQLWDTLQAFCSSITGTLATLAIMKGVGVGDSAATPLAATITWMLRDGTGMMGKILFAWTRGSDLDCNAKKWRLVADFMNDVATFLDLLAPLFPLFFLLIMCVSSLSKAVVGIAGAATRAAFVQHQARRDNMADVSAKDNSQETLVNLAALLVGLFMTPRVAGHPKLVWLLFTIFTCLHLFANYRAASVVTMDTFNQNRLHLAVEGYLRHGKVLGPKPINSREPLLRGGSQTVTYKLGVPLAKLLKSSADYDAAMDGTQKGYKYIIKFSRSQRCVWIALEKDSEADSQLKAAIVAELLGYMLSCQDLTSSPLLSRYAKHLYPLLQEHNDDGASLLNYTQSVAESHYADMVREMEAAGWALSHHLLGTDEWRYTWMQD